MLGIDDMEDGDDLICRESGRSGDWWVDAGGTGTIVPSATSNFQATLLGAHARPGSSYGMRLQGSGFTSNTDDWATLGFNFISQQVTYDVTPYRGFTFWAKVTSGSMSMRVNLGVPGTLPPAQGGTCMALCFDMYHVDVNVGTSWQQYQVSFEALAQEGWGPAPKDLAHAMFLDFAWGPPNPGSFDFWIDDLSFY
jgi:hypothetical protein